MRSRRGLSLSALLFVFALVAAACSSEPEVITSIVTEQVEVEVVVTSIVTQTETVTETVEVDGNGAGGGYAGTDGSHRAGHPGPG